MDNLPNTSDVAKTIIEKSYSNLDKNIGTMHTMFYPQASITWNRNTVPK